MTIIGILFLLATCGVVVFGTVWIMGAVFKLLPRNIRQKIDHIIDKL